MNVRKLYPALYGLMVLWLTVACSATATPTPVPTQFPTAVPTTPPTTAATLPAPTPRPTEQNASAPTPPAVVYTTADTLREYPLRLGAMWVYSSTHYDTIESGKRITTTWRVTDTVAAVEPRDEAHAAQVERTASLLDASINLDTLTDAARGIVNMPPEQSHWLIVRGNRIYEQFELDWERVDDAPLTYIFPVAASNQWYPDPAQRARWSLNAPDAQRVPGYRVVSYDGALIVPAGTYQDCAHVTEVWNPGNVHFGFCPGIGVVAEQFDHAGTPFGYRMELVEFRPPR